jgi:glycosyltransferase involved in cell wall biosynthesis
MLGRVGEAELAELYGGARAVAFIPYAEDYGYIALEAMLCAVPVITAHDAGGPTELVEDGRTGLVVDAEPQAMARAVDQLWRHPRERRRLGRAARVRAQQVTWDAVLEEILQ